ncbi:hypothetical protein IJ541_06670 [bacterium]|nr:hypothetical protein [bacterium]
MKKIAIITSENLEIISSIKNYFTNKDIKIEIIDVKNDTKNYDLIAFTGFETELPENFINTNSSILNIFPSLLPAFQTNTPIKDTFTSGVKVGGVTIHKVGNKNFCEKILAQYPVLIGLTTHYNEYIEELKAVSSKIYPYVIDALINDKVFDYSDLFKNKCSGCSGNCGNCKH